MRKIIYHPPLVKIGEQYRQKGPIRSIKHDPPLKSSYYGIIIKNRPRSKPQLGWVNRQISGSSRWWVYPSNNNKRGEENFEVNPTYWCELEYIGSVISGETRRVIRQGNDW